MPVERRLWRDGQQQLRHGCQLLPLIFWGGAPPNKPNARLNKDLGQRSEVVGPMLQGRPEREAGDPEAQVSVGQSSADRARGYVAFRDNADGRGAQT